MTLMPFVRQESPGNVGRLDAEAQERQERLEQHHARNREREIHDHDAQQVRQNMPHDDSRLASADRPGRFDEQLVPQRNHLAADDAGHRQPIDRPDDEIKDRDADRFPCREPRFDVFLTENRDEKDHDEDERHRIEDVDEPHHHVVDPAADVAGDRAVSHADHQRHDAATMPTMIEMRAPQKTRDNTSRPNSSRPQIDASCQPPKICDARSDHRAAQRRQYAGSQRRGRARWIEAADPEFLAGEAGFNLSS